MNKRSSQVITSMKLSVAEDQNDDEGKPESLDGYPRRKRPRNHIYEEGFEPGSEDDNSGNESDKSFEDNRQDPSEHDEICRAKT